MGIYAIWPYFACMAVLILFASTNIFSVAEAPPTEVKNRITSLDGLRGFLALAVFFHHAAIYDIYLKTGVWDFPPSPFYSMLGQFGVAMFFMITGYLFWGKMITHKGKPDWQALYISRLFRIGPLYLVVAGALIAIVAYRTKFSLAVPAPTAAEELARLLALGIFPITELNGVAQSWLFLAGVTWTLQYEWGFYASLLVLAFAAKREPSSIILPAMTSLAGLAFIAYRPVPSHDSSHYVAWASLFMVGALTAALLKSRHRPNIDPTLSSVGISVLLIVLFTFFDRMYFSMPIMLASVIFFLIAAGGTLSGLLTCRTARRLGDISYGIYLLQGLVLAGIFKQPWFRDIAVGSPEGHWIMTLVAGLVLVLLATATHVWVERPGIILGKRVLAVLQPLRATPQMASS